MRGIVIDGIGCGGKTVLIGALKEQLKPAGGFDVRELDHSDCEDQFARYLREYAWGERVLFHRSHVSELVFGPRLRHRCSFADAEVSTLNSVLSLRFLFVLAEPPDFETFKMRMAQRPRRRSFSEAEYLDVVGAFREACKPIQHEHYVSATCDDLTACTERILACLGVSGIQRKW